MGNVVSAGEGQNPARQAALNGGLPEHVAALTINKVCGSGLKAVMLADQGIRVGDIDVAVAGGMESMSNCPYLLPRVREGLRMGNGQVVDSMIQDGLWCAFEQCHMGNAGEVVAEHYHVSRRAQDDYAAMSHQQGGAGDRARARSATRFCRSRFRRRRARRSCSIATKPIRADTTAEALAALKPAFKKDGIRDGGQRARRERRRIGRRRDGGRSRQGAGARAHGAHRRTGDQRSRAEVRADDAGRGRPARRAEGRLESGGR